LVFGGVSRKRCHLKGGLFNSLVVVRRSQPGREAEPIDGWKNRRLVRDTIDGWVRDGRKGRKTVNRGWGSRLSPIRVER